MNDGVEQEDKLSDPSSSQVSVNHDLARQNDADSPQLQCAAFSSTIDSKVDAICEACKTRNISALAQLSATSGGFVSDQLRRNAWPILFDITDNGTHEDEQFSWKALPRHKDEDQVALDVNRAFVYYPNDEPDDKIEARKGHLSNVIVSTLRRYPMLCYFQGYHDIVQVLMLVLGETFVEDIVSRVSLLRIRDFMLPSLSPSLHHLELLPAILFTEDPKLCRHLSRTRPYFALASTLTLYAHDIQDYEQIARLFDFILAHEASVAIYLFAAIILSRRDELFEIEPDEPDMLHYTLSKMPKTLDLESLVSQTLILFGKHPPESLPLRAWMKISAYSVLKTTRVPDKAGLPRIQTLEEGQALFAKQAMILRRAQIRQQMWATAWKHRRTIGGAGVALLVTLFSIWLQRDNPSVFTSFPGWLLRGLDRIRSLW